MHHAVPRAGEAFDDDSLSARQVRHTFARGGFSAFEAEYEPAARLPDHEHAAPFFTYVVKGRYVECAGGETRECRRGAVIFHGALESHTNDVGPEGTVSFNVEIAPVVWQSLTAGLGEPRALVGRVLTGDVEWAALAAWHEFHEDDAVSTLGVEESITRIWSAAQDSAKREARTSREGLARCADQLSDHSAPPPRLAELARAAGVHPMHLTRLFRRRYGCSMGTFARRRRIAWACDQLAGGRETIASVALRAGFADQAHFTRTFRKVTGCTPGWYRGRLAAR